MPGRKYSDGSGYRYGFNGKENDNSTGQGSSDFGARVYDSRIGRWFATDSKEKGWISPYNFVSNNPINRIDPDGKDDIHFYFVTTHSTYSYGIGVNQRFGTITTTSARIEIVKTNGSDKFYHHKSSIIIDVAGGVGYNDRKTEFFPFKAGSDNGLTSTTYGTWPVEANFTDGDNATLQKYMFASSALVDYIQERGLTGRKVDDNGWNTAGKYYKANGYLDKFYGYAKLAENIAYLVEGAAMLLRPGAKNPFQGLDPGDAGAMGEQLMIADLTRKYEGQGVTITPQAYIKMNGKGMFADAVVSKNGSILEVAESKYNTSKIKTGGGQDMFFNDKQAGMLSGKQSANAGLSGIKIDPSKVKLSEYRWNTNGSGNVVNH